MAGQHAVPTESGSPEGGTQAGPYAHGFARVAACTIEVASANPAHNAAEIVRVASECSERGVGVAIFPELSLSGYAIDDLLLQDALLDAVEAGIAVILDASREWLPVVVVGAPLRHRGSLYNTAVVIHRGRVLGVVPKSYLPTYREFYERRQFTPGAGVRGEGIRVAGETVPFGTDLLFEAEDVDSLVLHVEVCEDMWVPTPPSAAGALAGATVLANISGSPITIGRADDRTLLARSASSRCLAAYVYAAAGQGESTTDLSWDGQTMIFENGVLLAEGERFALSPALTVADVDLDLLRQERQRMGTFADNRRAIERPEPSFRRVGFRLRPPRIEGELLRSVSRFPFVPDDPERLAQDCFEAYNIQVSGLEQRVRAIGHPKLVIGVSGGLDSTHALLVCAQALDRLGAPRSDILAYSLPGYATGDETKANAVRLCAALGIELAEIDIRGAADEMLRQIGHPYSEGSATYDVTFENVQAGLRTDYLFRLANMHGGIVVGTGDLSELALGWATYGVGDQMSHYAVNTGVPKTLMQHLIRWVAASGQFDAAVGEALQDVLGTVISPELIPGEETQSTEATIGPYELHDFTLWHVLRFGFRPSKIEYLASQVWLDATVGEWPAGFPSDARHSYTADEIRDWMRVFYRRFFANQFKRTAIPNGPKVSSGGSLSPRGDWRAPSDNSAAAWLDELG